MRNLIYLLLRRMRMPLIVIILAYAISILGLVLIPGVDDQGKIRLSRKALLDPPEGYEEQASSGGNGDSRRRRPRPRRK